MKRLLVLAVLLALALAPVAPAETVHNLLQQNNRALAPYDLSVIPELIRSNANVFFVDNEATNAIDAADGIHGETPELPFKTYDYAIGRCTAGQNNVIVVLPYSVERYTGAGSVDVDVSGITTIGLGYGPARPKFVFDNAAATFIVGRDGDGATFKNLTFQASVTGVTVGVQHEDGADNIAWIDCEWLDGELSGTDEFVTAYDFVAEANDVSFLRCRWTSVGAGATAAIDIGDGAVTGLRVGDCWFCGDYATAHVFSNQSNLRCLFKNSDFINTNADEYGIEFQGTGSTGIVRGCTFVTSGNYVDAGGLALVGNVYKTAGDSNTDGLSYSLADDGITAAKIADDAITAAEIADNAIDAGAIAANAITAANIADAAIDWATFAADAKNGLEDDIVASIDANSVSVAAIKANTDLLTLNNIEDNVQAAIDANGLSYWMERTTVVAADEVTADLMDVQGGPILITSIVGYVTAEIGGNATTCQLIVDRDDGTTDTEFTTAVNIEGDAVGTVYVFSNANPAVLTPLTPGATGLSTLMTPWFCPEGMLEQKMSADPGGAASDHITWYITWRPLAAGVTCVGQ